jgi:hypothetical protein
MSSCIPTLGISTFEKSWVLNGVSGVKTCSNCMMLVLLKGMHLNHNTIALHAKNDMFAIVVAN